MLKLKSSNLDLLEQKDSSFLSIKYGVSPEVPEEKFLAKKYVEARDKVAEEHKRTIRLSKNVNEQTGKNELQHVMDELLDQFDMQIGDLDNDEF